MAMTDTSAPTPAPAPTPTPSAPLRPGPKSPAQLAQLLAVLLEQHRAEADRLRNIDHWMSGGDGDIYVPAKVTDEYRRLVDQSKMNVLPLIERTVRQALSIDGYRPTTAAGRVPSPTNSAAWRIWQANRMDSRQSKLWGNAVRYGWSYALVVPGRPYPQITPWSPRELTTIWDDRVNDEWPAAALVVRRPLSGAALESTAADPVQAAAPGHVDAGVQLTIYDDFYSYNLVNVGGRWFSSAEARLHNLGVVPVVRYPDEEPSWTDPKAIATGKIEPVIPAQRQLNQITYALHMALHYGAFRQRHVSGMTVERDANGVPIQPFNVGVDRLLHATDPNVKWGEFGQTDVSGYLNARDRLLGFIGSVTQVPPHNLVIGTTIANLNAEALASLQYSHRRDLKEHQNLLGESAEQTLRLAGLADGDLALWEDLSARVNWEETEPRTLAEEADAYGKMATMLEIPPPALWRRLRGVTDQELAEWQAMADDRERSRVEELAALAGEIDPDDPAPPGDPTVP